MADGVTICALFVVFASLYLTSEYWSRILREWVPRRPLRCGVGFAVVHTLFVPILMWDGEIFSHTVRWQDQMLLLVDFPILLINAILRLDHYVKVTPLLWALYVLFAGGIQWFVLGALYGATSGWLTRVKRQGLNRERSAT